MGWMGNIRGRKLTTKFYFFGIFNANYLFSHPMTLKIIISYAYDFYVSHYVLLCASPK